MTDDDQLRLVLIDQTGQAGKTFLTYLARYARIDYFSTCQLFENRRVGIISTGTCAIR